MNQVFSIDHRRGAACDLERRTRQTRILVDATRDFTAKERPSNRDITAYKEMFYQWIDRILPADRRLLSTLLARSVFTPRAVAIYLATDTLDIAIPFLLYSPVLNELDLRNISEKKGQRHADVIARRQARPTAAPEGGATRREPLPKAEPVQPEKAEAKVQTIAREHPVRRESIPLGEAAVPTGPPVIDEAPQLAGEPLAATSAPAMVRWPAP